MIDVFSSAASNWGCYESTSLLFNKFVTKQWRQSQTENTDPDWWTKNNPRRVCAGARACFILTAAPSHTHRDARPDGVVLQMCSLARWTGGGGAASLRAVRAHSDARQPAELSGSLSIFPSPRSRLSHISARCALSLRGKPPLVTQKAPCASNMSN